MGCSRDDHQLGVGDPAVHREGVLKTDLIVVAEHDERSASDLAETIGLEGWFVEVHPGQLVYHYLIVAGSIRRDLRVKAPETRAAHCLDR